MKKRIICSWVGFVDYEASIKNSNKKEDRGPVLYTIEEIAGPRPDIHFLLFNQNDKIIHNYASLAQKHISDPIKLHELYNTKTSNDHYYEWLKSKTHKIDIQRKDFNLAGPNDTKGIYEAVMAVLEKIRGYDSECEIIFNISPGTPAMAAVWAVVSVSEKEEIKLVASSDYHLKKKPSFVEFPFKLAIEERERRVIVSKKLAKELSPDRFSDFICNSSSMRKTIETARTLSNFEIPILLIGEPGAGKKTIARAIDTYKIRTNSFIVVKCDCIPNDLFIPKIENHIFSNASGMLYFENISSLSKLNQAFILELLSNPDKHGALRFAASSDHGIYDKLKSSEFLNELFYAFSTGLINVPALRERGGDIILLTNGIIEDINTSFSKYNGWNHKELSSKAISHILKYNWTGNLSQLKSTIQRACVSNFDKGKITDTDMIVALEVVCAHGGITEGIDLHDGLNLKRSIKKVEYSMIHRALEICNGNQTKAAELLGISRMALHLKMREENKSHV